MSTPQDPLMHNDPWDNRKQHAGVAHKNASQHNAQYSVSGVWPQYNSWRNNSWDQWYSRKSDEWNTFPSNKTPINASGWDAPPPTSPPRTTRPNPPMLTIRDNPDGSKVTVIHNQDLADKYICGLLSQQGFADSASAPCVASPAGEGWRSRLFAKKRNRETAGASPENAAAGEAPTSSSIVPSNGVGDVSRFVHLDVKN